MSSGIALARESEVPVQKKELVAKADHRGLEAAEAVTYGSENVIEIDHHVGFQLL